MPPASPNLPKEQQTQTSSASPTQAPAQTPDPAATQQSEAALLDKVKVLLNWAIKTCDTDIGGRVEILKKRVSELKDMDQALAMSDSMTSIKSEMSKMKALAQGMGEFVQQPPPTPFSSDKLQGMIKSYEANVQEFQSTVAVVKSALQKTDLMFQTQQLKMVTLVKSLNLLMKEKVKDS